MSIETTTRWSWVGSDLLCPMCTDSIRREFVATEPASVHDLFERGCIEHGIRCATCFCGPTYDLESALTC